jgi:hypothetical protein
LFPEPVVSTVPVPDKLDVPEILKFEADEAVAPKETEVAPKVTAEFANEPFAIFVSVLSGPLIVLFVSVSVDVSVTTAPSVAIVNVLLDIDVVIPEPPATTKVSPKLMSSVVEESSLIEILEFAKLLFEIAALPDKLAFTIFDIVLLDALIVLFVNASVPANVAKSLSVKAVLNSAVVPVIVLSVMQ